MMKLSKTVSLYLFIVMLVSIPAFATIAPVGSYTITFERSGWSESKTINVQPFPTAESFYQVGGEDVNVYLQYVGQYGYGDEIAGYTWYVNAPAVLNDYNNLSLLGGTGDLTITISGLTLDNPDAIFVPLVTHIYYVGFNGDYVALDIPGGEPVAPGNDQIQRTPVMPVGPAEPGYNPSDPYYGTPYQDNAQPKLTFVLPEMYVPDSTTPIYELSFGAGFMLPEPSIIILMMVGAIGFFRRRRK